MGGPLDQRQSAHQYELASHRHMSHRSGSVSYRQESDVANKDQIIEAFPNDTAPRWLLRDRDANYGDVFRRRVAGMDITEIITSPSSPWQNPYAERLIGSLRRECLDHVIVLGERHLRCLLTAYLTYYHGARTHLALAKDAPTTRRVQTPMEGRVVAFPEVGGLHHRYERRAA
jgi:putative transposase